MHIGMYICVCVRVYVRAWTNVSAEVYKDETEIVPLGSWLSKSSLVFQKVDTTFYRNRGEEHLGDSRDGFLGAHSGCWVFKGKKLSESIPNRGHATTPHIHSTYYLINPSEVLGWPKRSFGFSHMMLWKNPNELFGQPNTILIQWFISLKTFGFCFCLKFRKLQENVITTLTTRKKWE